jgi:uncharacterized membrane protein
MKIRYAVFLGFLGLFLTIPLKPVLAEQDVSNNTEPVILAPGAYPDESRGVEARIIDIQIVSQVGHPSKQYTFTAEDSDGNRLMVDTRESFPEGVWYLLREGDTVLLQLFPGENGHAYLTDVRRTGALAWMLVLFAAVTIAIGLRRGVQAILGLTATVGMIGWFVLPRVLAGSNPVVICSVAAAVILGVTMHIAHGLNRRTFTAFVSSLLGLITVYLTAQVFVWFARLSGLGTEEELLLFLHSGTITIPSGILLGTIILGAAGALDDIAVTQTETVAELRSANPSLTPSDLFTRAMRVGRHHIASIVNTLVLAYTSVALPMLLLFLMTPETTIWQLLNQEGVAAEVVRTISGTLGLLLTVPIATVLAAYTGVRGTDAHYHHHT